MPIRLRLLQLQALGRAASLAARAQHSPQLPIALASWPGRYNRRYGGALRPPPSLRFSTTRYRLKEKPADKEKDKDREKDKDKDKDKDKNPPEPASESTTAAAAEESTRPGREKRDPDQKQKSEPKRSESTLAAKHETPTSAAKSEAPTLSAVKHEAPPSSAAKNETPSPPAPEGPEKAGPSAAASAAAAGPGPSGSPDGARRIRKSAADKSLQKPTVPEVYPQVLAIPITKRPLFPGFYKVVTIKDPNVSHAVAELHRRGQPYIGAFMVKDRDGAPNDDYDEDVIYNIDDVHPVGVFAQITSVLPINGQEGAVTVILYPHRRIRLSGLLLWPGDKEQKSKVHADDQVPDPIPSSSASASSPTVSSPSSSVSPSSLSHPSPIESREEQTQDNKKGDVVASFEEGVVSRPEPREPQHQQRQQYEPNAWLRKYPVSLANIENLADEPYDPKSPTIRAVTNEIVNVFKDVAIMNNLFRDQIATFSMSQSAGNVLTEPAKLADFAAAVSSAEREELQDILACLDVPERLQKALIVLKKELMNAELQLKITKEVETKISKRQREYWLMEQMKGIRRELGIESDGKDKLVEKFKAKANSLAMPEPVRKVFEEEVSKLSQLEPAAAEFNVTRNYLDWLTQIPWGMRSAENFSIQNAVDVLNEDHYGLEDVKDRILEFIAVGKLRGTVEGKILCFVGPPGVGKTSIGKSIARALNRQCYRFSVGGLTDVAEIKGHRRTYVGALPGRIIQALKKCQTENPLVLIDEIDKIGRGWQGDPSSALLELLDPEQNNSFLDHYMDVPVDLSRVLFVCTANMTDTIPRPLLDRMEIITLSGYVADEKMAIADKYLAPAARAAAGLENADVVLTKDGIEELIKSYCRESGVRSLKKQIEKVYRKAALKIVQELGEEALPEESALTAEGKAALEKTQKDKGRRRKQDHDRVVQPTATATEEEDGREEGPEDGAPAQPKSGKQEAPEPEPKVTEAPEATEAPRVALSVPQTVHVKIDKEALKDYVGPPIFTSDRLYDVNPAGVAMGLAWTQMGGAAMYVESIIKAPPRPRDRPEMEITGNLKQVMEESSKIAYSFAKSFMTTQFPDNHFLHRAKLHLHVPDGAVPKDGPSAGITMATALLSLALNAKVNPDVAMTGELTLTGKVLRIGGLREKTVAARRAGCKMIIFPQDNMSDWLELPKNIKDGIEGHAVSWYSDVFNLVFPGLDREEANRCRICQWKEQNSQDVAAKSEEETK